MTIGHTTADTNTELPSGNQAGHTLATDVARFALLDDHSLFGVRTVIDDLQVARTTATATGSRGHPGHHAVVGLGWRIATELRRRGAHADARRVVDVLGPMSARPVDHAAMRLVGAHLDVLQHRGDGNWASHVPEVMAQSNAALDAGDTTQACDLLMIVLDVMFDYEHHADVVATPLIDDTHRFLAPLRSSAVLDLLATPRTGRAPEEGRATPPGAEHSTTRVAMVFNRYRHFADELVASLRARADVELRIETIEDVTSRGGRTDQGQVLVDHVVVRRDGGLPAIPDHDREWLEWADVVVVDWADVGAQWASLHVPVTTRLVVRIHSIEALMAHPHLIDWSRVDDLVFVGEHVREFLVRAVPALTQGPRLHVLPNAMDLQRFDTAKSAAAGRTLALVGWAQRVKDPVWALEVLAELRREDPSWRVLLVGAGFSSGTNVSNRRYRILYEETVARLGLGDAIEQLGYRDDLEAVFGDVGFIVSSSRRESFGVALCEGAASGAVPVVRHWTMYHLSDGPRALFPDDWVVDDVRAAAARIQSMADPRVRSVMGARARRFVLDRYDWGHVEQDYLDVILDLQA